MCEKIHHQHPTNSFQISIFLRGIFLHIIGLVMLVILMMMINDNDDNVGALEKLSKTVWAHFSFQPFMTI